jgi:nitric oxide synthase-interacting protein
MTSHLSVMKPCSHVVCKACQDALVARNKQCVVCDERLSEKDSIQLVREGDAQLL